MTIEQKRGKTAVTKPEDNLGGPSVTYDGDTSGACWAVRRSGVAPIIERNGVVKTVPFWRIRPLP